jgi:hypothetical protein
MRDNAVVGVLKWEEKLEMQKQIRHLEGQGDTKSDTGSDPDICQVRTCMGGATGDEVT